MYLIKFNMHQVKDSLHAREEKLESINVKKIEETHKELYESNFDFLEKKYKSNKKFLEYLRKNKREMEEIDKERQTFLEQKRIARKKRIEELQKMKLKLKNPENDINDKEDEPLFEDNRSPPPSCCHRLLGLFNLN